MLEASYETVLSTPVGLLRLRSDGRALLAIHFLRERDGMFVSMPDPEDEILRDATGQLRAYFDGALQAFDLPLRLTGTDFQRLVWEELCRIPFGHTVSYAEVARRIGCPTACRAIGAANGRNPIPLIVPCHRVIGSSKALTGYGGGLEIKRWLLEHEAKVLRGPRPEGVVLYVPHPKK